MSLHSGSVPAFTITDNVDLTHRNTFGVPARAGRLIEVNRTDALGDALREIHGPLLVLGGGSNVLFTRDWPGTIVALTARGITVADDDGESARLRVEAGLPWDEFVHWSLARGFAGLENLVAIPGSTGAAPIQNIGAYGCEIREWIANVETMDPVAGSMSTFDNAACRFSYRDSRFKREPDRAIITAVEFMLPRVSNPRLDYPGVREELATMGPGAPSPTRIADAIARIRHRKLPDPRRIGNAGSFFKNPVVHAAEIAGLRVEFPSMPSWPRSDGRVKLSAAWLVDTCGFKGLRDGSAGVSSTHALVLVNLGGATGMDLLRLAHRIQDTVQARFGIALEPEPRIV